MHLVEGKLCVQSMHVGAVEINVSGTSNVCTEHVEGKACVDTVDTNKICVREYVQVFMWLIKVMLIEDKKRGAK